MSVFSSFSIVTAALLLPSVACAIDPLPTGPIRKAPPVYIVQYAAAGSMDGDALYDIAVPKRSRNLVEVSFGIDDDTFTEPVELAANRPYRAIAADLDLDGVDEICISNHGDNTVQIYLNDGMGNFDPGPVVDLGFKPGMLVALDDDGDDLPDLIVGDPATGDPLVAIYNDGMQFTRVKDLIPDGPRSESASGCGDPPDCDPVYHQGTGIQACIDAAHCRRLICSWDACEDYMSGRIGWWTLYRREILCGTYKAADVAGCIKEVNPF